MNKWIAQFFRHFDAEIVDKERPFKVRSFWFATQGELDIRKELQNNAYRDNWVCFHF